MKRNVIIALTATAIFAVSSCGNEKKVQESEDGSASTAPSTKEQHAIDTGITFKDDRIAVVFEEYQHMRMALINSNFEDVQVKASALGLKLTDDYFEIESIVLDLATAYNIEKQRELFSQLTTTLEPFIKESLSGGKVYKQFCPMAFNNEGGYWLSDASAIYNPYYGDKMLKCGKVTETMEK
jgi:hypothetical protein